MNENVTKIILSVTKIGIIAAGIVLGYQVLDPVLSEHSYTAEECEALEIPLNEGQVPEELKNVPFDELHDELQWKKIAPDVSSLFFIIYVVAALCGITAVLFGLYWFIANFKERLGTVIGVGCFGILAVLSYYGLADGTVLGSYEVGDEVVSEETVLKSGAAVILTYLLIFAAIGSIAVTEIIKIFK